MNSEKIKKVLREAAKDPSARFAYLSKLGLYNWMSDAKYLKRKYKSVFGRELDLEHPKTYNEKLQWLKLYDRKDQYTIMADKYRAKQYVTERLGEGHVVPLLGVWDDPDEIDFSELPAQFVLKCNHNSGTGMCICRDKSALDISHVKKQLRKGLRENYYFSSREWPYKNIERKVIAEEYLSEGQGETCLTDYKFFCFDGVPKIAYISKDNAENATTDFFDMEFNPISLQMKDPHSKIPPDKPPQFDEMKRIAGILACGIPHLRVDFYCVDNHIYVGEMTFYHNGGFGPVNPEKWAQKMGEWIVLPDKN